MESLFIRKILNVCEVLLFGNTKITLPTFLKKCKKQNVKIICAVAERVVAFLQTLPKNLALFQALEPAFGYILKEQLTIPKEHQEFILRAEKLEFKNHITSYELAGSVYLIHLYKDLFTKSFADMIKRKERNDSQLVWFLGQMWLKHGDKKNFKYKLRVDAHFEAIDLHYNNITLDGVKTYDTFREMAFRILSKCAIKITKIHEINLHYE